MSNPWCKIIEVSEGRTASTPVLFWIDYAPDPEPDGEVFDAVLHQIVYVATKGIQVDVKLKFKTERGGDLAEVALSRLDLDRATAVLEYIEGLLKGVPTDG